MGIFETIGDLLVPKCPKCRPKRIALTKKFTKRCPASQTSSFISSMSGEYEESGEREYYRYTCPECGYKGDEKSSPCRIKMKIGT